MQVINALQIYKPKHITIENIAIAPTKTITSAYFVSFKRLYGIKPNINTNTDIPNKSSIKCISIPPILMYF